MTIVLALLQILGVIAVFWLPGLLVLWTGGLRGWLRLVAIAPAITLAVFAFGAVGAALVDLRWTLLTAAACTAVAAAAALLLRRRFWPAAAAPSPSPVAAVRSHPLLAGAIAASVLVSLAPVWQPLLTRDRVQNLNDGTFHLNALQYVRTEGVVDPVTLGTLVDVRGADPLYPWAWHSVAGLAPVVLDNTSLFAAAAFVVVALSWATGIASLARVVTRSRRPALVGAVAAALAGAGLAVPFGAALEPGIVPNMVGVALLPAAAAVAFAVARARNRTQRAPLVLALVVGCAGITATHPGALAALLLGALPWWPAVIRAAWRRAAPVARRIGVGAGVVILSLAVVVFTRNEQFETVRSARNEIPMSLGDSVVGLLLGRTTESVNYAIIPMAFAIAAAVVRARRREDLRPVISWVLLAATYLLAANAVAWATPLTGLFYVEGRRVATFVAIWTTVLAAEGLARGMGWLVVRVRRPDRMSAQAAAGALCAVLVVLSTVLPFRNATDVAQQVYYNQLVDPINARSLIPFFAADELAMVKRLPSELPSDAVVVGSHMSGSSHLYGLEGIQVVPFHGPLPDDLMYASDHLAELATDPAVCRAFRAHGVTHLYFDVLLLKGKAWPLTRPPFINLPDDGLRLVDEGGPARVYEITGCG